MLRLSEMHKHLVKHIRFYDMIKQTRDFIYQWLCMVYSQSNDVYRELEFLHFFFVQFGILQARNPALEMHVVHNQVFVP